MSLFPFLSLSLSLYIYRYILEPIALKQVASRQMPRCHLRDAHKTTRWVSNKDSACQCRRHQINPCVKKIPWSRKRQPTLVFLPGKFNGQKRVVSTGSQRIRHDGAHTKKQWIFVKEDTEIKALDPRLVGTRRLIKIPETNINLLPHYQPIRRMSTS